ncbi:MAG: calcium-translocating P-type ATPase, PMCA-type [Microgenomates group bacterium Gr01-1014_93]|nr:MAG: calcium-translocating P-type ATPase, PMCA-type [Microgenomates group bacterium Gr01-1014_93]
MNEMHVQEVVANKKDLSLAIKTAVLCNSASLVPKEDGGSVDADFDILGDTTEGALLLWANENKVSIDSLRSEGKILNELSFNLKRRIMSVVWQHSNHETYVYSKGAPEVVLPLCNLSKIKLESLKKEYKRLATKGLRVLAIAAKPYISQTNIENNLDFLALVGIADEPRQEAKEAIIKARAAGIEVVMITGDNELTAKAIAEKLTLIKKGDDILTGSQLDELTDEELLTNLDKIRIFARVIPEHKLRIIKAYQTAGKVVAVTGDGVNDAMALKQAHVGVAMGITGTDVAKEAADIVILDDNLSTIVAAIEQGRIIYNNILKVIKFLLTGNLSEVLTIVTITLIGYPAPLLAVQILWINFVTDGLPALSLAGDSASANVMKTPPRNISQPFLNFYNLRFILGFGTAIALVNIVLFIFLFHLFGLEFARNVIFTTMVISQMIFIFLMRRHHSITSNKYLLASVGLVLILQTMIYILPPLRTIFKI